MAESLIALLLVNGSAGGPNLVFRWPPAPKTIPRLARPRPATAHALDNPWRALFGPKGADFPVDAINAGSGDDDYTWTTSRPRSQSFKTSASGGPRTLSIPPSVAGSPTRDDVFVFGTGVNEEREEDDYRRVLGYSGKFLAGILCPPRTLCHQKFELVVDDLVFIGHPVCADARGAWKFVNPGSAGGRGRTEGEVLEEGRNGEDKEEERHGLETFHFVVVLDQPDPSSSAMGNVAKYFDIIYEQIAFTFAAVLFQEQVLSNFVELECEQLQNLKEKSISNRRSFSEYMDEALYTSSIASAMRTLYDAIRSSSIAYIKLNNLPLELQLPPYLGTLLHHDVMDDVDEELDDDEPSLWGREMSTAWRLPALAPWKSLLLLDVQEDPALMPYVNLRAPHVRAEDRHLAEGLLKFLEIAEITLSLAEMANGLEWDLESQVYPTVRWLVQHRRAKVVDVVHAKLRTRFTLPAKFSSP